MSPANHRPRTVWYTTTYNSPIGPLRCAVDAEGAVVRIVFPTGRDADVGLDRLAPRGVTLVEDAERNVNLIRQLDEYFAGERVDFDLDVAPNGTDFQQRVWAALQTIPYGETRSYAEIGRSIGRPKASRAVGRANGTNPVPIVIPCHRVIGADGSLTGFGGGLETKTHLLALEGALPEPSTEPRQARLGLSA